MPRDVVAGLILAAGEGVRFGDRKQFVEVRGRRLIDKVVEDVSEVCDHVVVVLPPNMAWDGQRVTAAVGGGGTRAASVRSGLAAISPSANIVLVHDPAHPLVGPDLMRSVIGAVRDGADAALPAVSLPEPLKRIDGGRVARTIPRDGIMMVQGPQAFRADVLRGVHADEPDALEDSELVERNGGTVVVVPGETRNIHVITPSDLVIVAGLIG